MTNYLIHQKRDGTPMGVFTETAHYYHPDSKNHQPYGVSVVAARGSEVEWDDWIDQVADKMPGPTDTWEVFPDDDRPLADVLDEARSDLSYE